MFLAIFNDTYAEVKGEKIVKNPVIWPYLKKVFRSRCCKWKPPVEEESKKEEVMLRKAALQYVSSVHKQEILESFFEVIKEPTTEKMRK